MLSVIHLTLAAQAPHFSRASLPDVICLIRLNGTAFEFVRSLPMFQSQAYMCYGLAVTSTLRSLFAEPGVGKVRGELG